MEEVLGLDLNCSESGRVAAAPIGQFGAIQTVAQSLGVDLAPVGVRDADEIEHGITAFARSPDVGLIVTADWRLVAM